VISDETEKAVRELADGTVSRISGQDPFELAVRFAKYKSADGRFGFGKVGKTRTRLYVCESRQVAGLHLRFNARPQREARSNLVWRQETKSPL